MLTRLMCRMDLAPIILDRATAEIQDQYLDCRKVRQLLGWSPRFSLDEGLRRTIEWYATFLCESGAR